MVSTATTTTAHQQPRTFFFRFAATFFLRLLISMSFAFSTVTRSGLLIGPSLADVDDAWELHPDDTRSTGADSGTAGRSTPRRLNKLASMSMSCESLDFWRCSQWKQERQGGDVRVPVGREGRRSAMPPGKMKK